MANITHFDLLTREIDIKGLSQVIIVMTDNNSSKIKFIYDVTDDFSDVATKINNGTYNVWVKFLSPSDYMSKTLISDITYTEGSLSFVWNIPKEALVEKGSLQFAIEILGTDFRLSTKASNIYIYETVNKDDVTMTPAEEAWMIQYDEKFLGYISQMDGKFDTAINTATEKASQASQSATNAAYSAQAAENSAASSVKFTSAQTLTTLQRYQARKNIGAAAVVDIKDAYELQEAVRQGRANQILSVGDFFTVGRGGTDWLFQAAAFDYDVPVKTQYTHSMRLLMYPCFGNVAFDAQEAIYYAAAELAAGTYWFVDSRANKYCSFTTTTAVPAGGQIVLAYGASPDYTITSAKTYASQTSTTALETATVTVSDTTPAAGTQLTPVNDGSRARFGSNNWMQSAIRQWLSSSATTGWWTAKNNYDRPQSAPADGFLNGIDADLLACIGKVRLRTGLNPVDNAGTFGYSDNEELIFLPSRTEMGLGNSGTNIYETPVAADGTAKTTTMPLFTDNASRIKYLAGVARYWWMRSPHPNATSANLTYTVFADGSLSGSNALGGSGAVPACVIY